MERIKGTFKGRKAAILCAVLLTMIILLGPPSSASAQFKLKLPRIPKITQDRPEQPETTATKESGTTHTAPTAVPQNDPPWFVLELERVAETRKSVDEYDPATKVWLVNSSRYDHLLYAVSQKARTKWLTDEKIISIRDKPNNKLDAALDELAAAAAKKIPTYKAKLTEFKFRNPSEEKLMKSILSQIANYKIHSAGLAQTNWLIAKNDYGLPIRRFKSGAIYLKDVTDDHPYCYLTYINIMQDYSGGGTYGDSYAEFIKDELIGCPASR